MNRGGWAAAAFALAFALAPLTAQAVREERRTIAAFAERCHELWLEARGVPAERRAAADAALAADPAGDPFAPLARALAALRDVPFDDAFAVRAAVQVIALPEVVDPEVFEDAERTIPYRLHVTLHAPLRPRLDGPFRFDVRLLDADGEVVRRTEAGPATAEDLTRFAATVAIPVHDLPDGRYRVRVTTEVAGEDPRPADPVGGADVLVRRGFAADARALDAAIEALLAERTEPAERAVLLGALWPLQRVYTGEASDGTLDLAADLAHAKRVVGAAREDAPLLDGARGFMPLAFALEPGPRPHHPNKTLRACLRLPAARDEPRPLVVFLSGPPSWDGRASRPAPPAVTRAGWLARALAAADFDAGAEWSLLVLESSGAVELTPAVLAEAIGTTAALTGADRARIVLVGEREAATDALSCLRAKTLPEPPRAIVCVGGGALSPPEMGLLERTELLLVGMAGHPSSENFARLRRFAEAAGVGERVHATEAVRAWSWALRGALPEIEAFCAARLR